jgi:hypothetical protein
MRKLAESTDICSKEGRVDGACEVDGICDSVGREEGADEGGRLLVGDSDGDRLSVGATVGMSSTGDGEGTGVGMGEGRKVGTVVVPARVGTGVVGCSVGVWAHVGVTVHQTSITASIICRHQHIGTRWDNFE